jgi:hypothetical protein
MQREPKSLVSIIPIGVNILVRRITNVSNIMLRGSMTIDKLNSEDYNEEYVEVVGYGEATGILEIGHKVIISMGPAITPVHLKDNPNEFYKVRDLVKSLSINDIKNADKSEIHSYYLVPQGFILGYEK